MRAHGVQRGRENDSWAGLEGDGSTENSTEDIDEFGGRVGFTEELLGQLGVGTGHGVAFVEAAAKDDGETWLELSECGQGFPTIHPGH